MRSAIWLNLNQKMLLKLSSILKVFKNTTIEIRCESLDVVEKSKKGDCTVCGIHGTRYRPFKEWNPVSGIH